MFRKIAVVVNDVLNDTKNHDSEVSLTKVIMDISKDLPPEVSRMVVPFLLRYGADIQKFSKMIPPEIMDKAQYLPGVLKQYTPFIKEGLNFLMEQKEKSRAERKEVFMNAIREITPEIALAVVDLIETNEIKTRLAQQELGQ